MKALPVYRDYGPAKVIPSGHLERGWWGLLGPAIDLQVTRHQDRHLRAPFSLIPRFFLSKQNEETCLVHTAGQQARPGVCGAAGTSLGFPAHTTDLRR